MPGSEKAPRQPKANQLHDQSKPNTLSGGGAGPSPIPDARPEAAGVAGQEPDQAAYPEIGPAPYGPNSESVVSMLADLDRVDRDRAEQIADSWEAVPAVERQVSQMMVRRLRRQREYEGWLSAAESRIDQWRASQQPAGQDDTDVYTSAADAMRDAAAALILDQELADTDFAILYGAWSDVMDEEGEDEVEDEVDGEEPEDEEEPEAEEEEDEDEEEPEEEPEGEEEPEFGPNTDLVHEFLGLLDEIETARMGVLAAAWRAQTPAQLRNAHKALQTLAREDPRYWAQIHDAQTAVSRWARGRVLQVAASHEEGVDVAEFRRAALPAAIDAVSALVMADMLEPGQSATLYGPWALAVGKPELPQYEEDDEDEEPERDF
jgi:hypothetical protein